MCNPSKWPRFHLILGIYVRSQSISTSAKSITLIKILTHMVLSSIASKTVSRTSEFVPRLTFPTPRSSAPLISCG